MKGSEVTPLHVSPVSKPNGEDTVGPAMAEGQTHAQPVGVVVNAGVVLAGVLTLLVGAVGAQVFFNANTLARIDAKLGFYVESQTAELAEVRKEVSRLEAHLNTIWPRLRGLEQEHDNIRPDLNEYGNSKP